MNEVVKVNYPDPAICIIKMEDKETKNAFSEGIKKGLQEAFSSIQKNPEVKVVIVTGYENYFAIGGDESILIDLASGKKTVAADYNFFKFGLDCEVITIAAVQGHAFGGGLAFASHFDYMLLAKEGYYSAIFMKYGFTPGMGSTYSLPKKFGDDLGREMLFSAKQYSGKELFSRNPTLRIYPRKEVVEKALELAKEFTDKPVASLKLLKKSFVESIQGDLASKIKQEDEMHAKTLSTPETLERLKKLFNITL